MPTENDATMSSESSKSFKGWLAKAGLAIPISPVRERHGAPGSRGTIRSQSSDTLENPPGPNRIRRNRLLLGRSAARTVSGAGDLNSSSKARGDLSLHVTSAMVRELRELIRYRYALDHKILSVGKKAKPSQRDSVRDDMRRADAAMVTIRNMLENWDNPEHFSTAEQYQVFLEIKARIANGESRDWLRRPPWAEEQHDADDNIYEKDERSTQPLNNDLPNKRYPRDRLSPEDAQRLLNRHPFAEDLNDQISQRRTVLMNQVHLDQWPEVPDEKLHWTEEDFYPKPVPDAPPGTPESSLDSISKNLGEYSEPQVPAISPEIEVEARNVYSRHVPSSRNDIPHPVFEESEGSESLSDTEEIAFPAVSNNKQPAFVAAILNAIVSDFGLSQMLQDLLQQASTKFPHEELVDLFSNMLQRYHGEVISDSRTAIKPQVKEVLGIGRFRDIVARRVLDKHILARLDSDDETSDKATDRLTLSSKLNSFSNISSESWAFRNLLNSIKELLLPSDLLDDLLPIPRCHITYETSRDPTAFETLQWRFEELTDLEWDWWPLPPSKRRLYSGESRVLWRCSCGMTRWRELPIEQQGLLREVLVHRPVESGTVSSCMVTQQPAKRFSIPFRMVLGSGSSIGRNPGQARSTTSSARSRYTPAGNRSNIGSCAQGGSAANNAGSVSQTATTPGNPTASNVPLCTNKQLWIIFGVEGPLEPLELSQINNDYLHNDQIFIRELRQRHWKLRGWPRILFSIWRLRYWEFVKFDPQPYGPNRAVVQDIDLPVSQDYVYNPRPPKVKATDEGIRHSFTAMVQACIEPCGMESLPFGHVCRRLKGKKTHYIDRIPKRLKEWTSDDEDPDEPYVWGIQARYRPCILAVWMIHTLILSGAFGFWGWWQKNHKSDLQGAAVPLTIAIALISLFWSTTGVIPSLR